MSQAQNPQTNSPNESTRYSSICSGTWGDAPAHDEVRLGCEERAKEKSEPKNRLITLITDFGLQDGYVGALKGVILTICPRACVVDITHMIPPGDVRSAAYVLRSAYPHFPKGSIHLGVVDPGVGSSRKAVAIQAGTHTFVGPDNGLFSWVLHRESDWECRCLENEDIWGPEVSRTFHGRDIFGPVAAHLANGFPFEELGPVHHPILSDWIRVSLTHGNLSGRVIHVDRFGNVVTNVRYEDLDAIWPGGEWRVFAGGRHVARVVSTYAEGPEGSPVALVGSSGHIEIAVNCGDAAQLLGILPGDPVIVGAVASKDGG